MNGMVESKQPQQITSALAAASVDVSMAVSIGTSMPSCNTVREAGTEDILQQALQEVSHEYPTETVIYGVDSDSTLQTVDDSEIVPCVVSTSSDPEMTIMRIVNSEGLVLGDEQEPHYAYFTETGEALQTFNHVQPYNYVTSAYPRESDRSHDILPEILDDANTEAMQPLNLVCSVSNESLGQSSTQTAVSFLTTTSTSGTNSVQGNTVKLAPLGSSQNPIRIIQQGNQYKSLQNLTPEQFTQIMQVVQQQQLLRTSQQTGQASILYNPQTQTKIVFRVVYPSELHKTTSLAATSQAAGGELSSEASRTETVTQIQKKTYQKRKHTDEVKGVAPELSKLEKELRKKHRPRTRYGRVSRPPLYMVKDYKHIHPVDYDEDYDDSDGGYSDFKEGSTDDEGNTVQKTKGVSHIALGQPGQLGNGKPRKHKCSTCEKGYIGIGGLARHYRLNPSHGSLANDLGTNVADSYNSSDSFQSTSMAASVAGSATGNTQPMPTNFTDGIAATSSAYLELVSSAAHLTSGRNKANIENATQTGGELSSSSVVETSGQSTTSPQHKDLCETAEPHSGSSTPLPSQAPRRGRRGRPPSHQQAERRKERLLELVRHCTDEELMEVVMPRLSASVNLWEFLLMKTERKASQPDISEMIKEFEDLHKQLGNMLDEKLSLVSQETTISSGNSEETMETESKSSSVSVGCHIKNIKTKSTKTYIELSEGAITRCLGFSAGRYEFKDNEPVRQYKLLTSNPALVHQNPSQTTLRTVEIVPHEQLIALPLRKRLRLTETSLGTTSTTVASNSSSAAAASEYNWTDCLPVALPDLSKADVLKASNDELTESANDLEARDLSLCDSSISMDSSSVVFTTTDSYNHPVVCSAPNNDCLNAQCLQEGKGVHGFSAAHVSAVIDGAHGKGNERNALAINSEFLFSVKKSPNSAALTSSSPHCIKENLQADMCQFSSTAKVHNDISHYYNGNFGHIVSSCDSRMSLDTTVCTPTTVAAVHTLTIDSGMDELQSLFEVKSESENKSCPTSAYKSMLISESNVADAGYFAISSGDIEISESLQVTVEPECQTIKEKTDEMIDPDHPMNENMQFMSDNLAEAAVDTETDFTSSSVTDFVGDVDDKMGDSHQLLIQDCEMGEYTSNHQEIQLNENAQIIQTNEGLIIIRNPDGTIQIHGNPGQQISFETVQAVIGIDQDSQMMFESIPQS